LSKTGENKMSEETCGCNILQPTDRRHVSKMEACKTKSNSNCQIFIVVGKASKNIFHVLN